MSMEIRRLTAELRTSESPSGNSLVGHASVFNQVAQIRDGFERIDPEAFNRALRDQHDVVLLANHDGLPLARTTNGTLRLGVDAAGLTVDADLADTSLGRDVRTLMARGDLTKMSFGFVPTADRYDEVDGYSVRTITDLDLFDVSVVNEPAYAGTDAQLRAWTPVQPVATQRSLTGVTARLALYRAQALLARIGKN